MRRTNSLEKTLMLGKIEGRRRRGRQKMIWLNGITDSMDMFEQTPGIGDGQGSLACCSRWGCKESDTTEWLDWTELNWATDESSYFPAFGVVSIPVIPDFDYSKRCIVITHCCFKLHFLDDIICGGSFHVLSAIWISPLVRCLFVIVAYFKHVFKIHIVDVQCHVSFSCIAAWFSSFSDSLPLHIITKYPV